MESNELNENNDHCMAVLQFNEIGSEKRKYVDISM